MVNDIITGIVKAIRAKYNKDDYKVATEQIQQSFVKPSFFIKNINQSQTQVLMGRYARDNDFVIHYFPDQKNKYANCHEVAESLYDALELIEVEGKLWRGIGMSAQIEDGVLLFFVSYNTFVLKQNLVEKMEEVNINAKTREKRKSY